MANYIVRYLLYDKAIEGEKSLILRHVRTCKAYGVFTDYRKAGALIRSLVEPYGNLVQWCHKTQAFVELPDGKTLVVQRSPSLTDKAVAKIKSREILITV